ncbi:MAG TPA: cytidylate kinase-like family protein [Gemmatimonadaceae bacterium]|nr:cytidylate kinase-like family protein [Gemmatimonadaceae bacterium]
MPFVTISRMYGSGGSEIAEKVARMLGWTLYDNEMVDAIAQRSGLTASEVAATEERVPSLVERISGAFTLGTPEAMPAFVEGGATTPDEEIVATTKVIIDEAVKKGPAVFVGRGAQCLLAARSDGLHVFCHAPLPALVDYAVKTLGIPPADAEKKVNEMNRQREQYVKRHWNRKWMSPLNYNLCIDTAWYGMDGAAELIARTARERLR